MDDMGNTYKDDKVRARDLTGAIINLHNLLSCDDIVCTSELTAVQLAAYMTWEYEQLVIPVIAHKLKTSDKATIRQLARVYNVGERLVYQIGLKVGRYGQNTKVVLNT